MINTTSNIVLVLLGILTYLGLTPRIIIKYFKDLNNTIIIRGIVGLLTLLLILFLIILKIHKYFIPEPARNLEDLIVPFLLKKGTYKTSESKYRFRMFVYYCVVVTQYAVLVSFILVVVNYVLNNKLF